jgi:hypothetical protein
VPVPTTALAENLGLVGADLLSQLTQRRLARGFARINAALWHLPLRQPRRHPDAVADEHETVAAEQHDANPRAVGC